MLRSIVLDSFQYTFEIQQQCISDFPILLHFDKGHHCSELMQALYIHLQHSIIIIKNINEAIFFAKKTFYEYFNL